MPSNVKKIPTLPATPALPHNPIYLGIGGNLPMAGYDSVVDGCVAALTQLAALPEVRLHHISAWYRTAPVPLSDQPYYSNAVAHIGSTFSPEALLAAIHALEAKFGRTRREANAPRPLDIDIIDFAGMIRTSPPPILPHPRMASRKFVLTPLAELAPNWQHPATKQTIAELLADLPIAQKIKRI